jgi:hypothetical protein
MTSDNIDGKMDPSLVLERLLTGCMGHVATSFGRLNRAAALAALRRPKYSA